MGKLEESYLLAIEQTKYKIIQDIDRYLEDKEKMPVYTEYISDRHTYLEGIWLNVWLNKASNDVPRKEKRTYLKSKGLNTNDIPHKVLNTMFRNELKGFDPFPVLEWLTQMYAENAVGWEQRYLEARANFFKRQNEKKLAEERWNVRLQLQSAVHDYIDNHSLLLYIYVRNHVAEKLVEDFKHNQRYQNIELFELEERLIEQGSFDTKDYIMVDEFFEELTGAVHSVFDWGRSRYEYETYYYRYEKIVQDFLSEFVPELVIKYIPEELLHKFAEVYEENLSTVAIKGLLGDELNDFAEACFEEIQDEYLADLVKLIATPFDEVVHLEIFEKDEQEREQRKAEALAEQVRKKEEEERILNDIFGKAYAPSLGRSIKYILHIGETNTGKTHQALQKMKEAESGLYLAPLRLLAFEVSDKLNAEGIPCTLKTGEEEKVIAGAKHYSSTVEMFHEKDHYDVIVIDEAQMIADKDRGFSWYRAIMNANAKEVHVIGSWNIKNMLLTLLEESNVEFYEYSREFPLEVESRVFSLRDAKKGDALVCFSRRQVLETASSLQRSGHRVSMIYGSMPPETRKKQMELFTSGETTVVVATDAIGMGLNLPIRRIVFLENEKFDGTSRRTLTSQEIKQIAGRAGRIGLYDIGKVAFTADIKKMQALLEKIDEPVQNFAIAPTSAVFERFQKYYRDLGTFFDLWTQFDPPKGTNKASLIEERERYELVRDTEIEARYSLMDLYGYLHLPFSSKEPALIRQWLNTLEAIAEDRELPEPLIKTRNLEDMELSYKAIGLHLLFLYRLGRKTEAVYWERVREDISNSVHDHLKDELQNYQKKCKRCGKKLPDEARFPICDACFQNGHKRNNQNRFHK